MGFKRFLVLRLPNYSHFPLLTFDLSRSSGMSTRLLAAPLRNLVDESFYHFKCEYLCDATSS